MSLLKKISVLAVIMIALIIPAAAISGSAAGDVTITGDVKAGGFDDRTSGTVTVKLYNSGETATGNVTVSVVKFDDPEKVYAKRTVSFTGDETDGMMDVGLSFRVGTPGTYWAVVMIEGDDVLISSEDGPAQDRMTFEFTVGQSIWSSTWTYVAIVIVIIIVAIAVFIRMRGAPKVDDAGTFTAMEEERKAGKGQRSGRTEKEEYKGRKKN
ncbi:MAG: hypothetical protein FWG58_05320 [Methanomassiliicoccaceae archaeon]|nr:hypothetical protein [Methanomassiliicoccaceae archaeon]